ncbi:MULTISPECIES: hypothetical protein [unclassified Streptomyces]|uniref:hypothetical protein n=1 Tax=unclassified Streptomyces TaxID=2593676 RepID=UPI00081B6DBB|nr:hypothetical protein [Streptomyces sp. BvitLS-983]MYX86807.1 hypothetical protein [Streptomyces sp. SID4915]SCD92850.1 hypothetical protein GA0115250_12923 [Streptomyces sp. BvitLS-983]
MAAVGTELRAVTRGGGAAMTALVSGSVILTRRLCGCVGTALVWAWDLASVDGEATAAAQAGADQRATAKAVKVAKAAAENGDDQAEARPVSAPPVRPVRRPAVEALGMLGIGGGLVAGAVATVWPLVAPHLAVLAAWRGVIASAVTLAWMAAAWMVAPAPPAAPVEEDVEEEVEEAEEAASPADLLARHVLEQLAELEAAGRRGVHVTALISSAEEAGLLQLGAMDKVAMRAWLPASGIPVTKSVKVAGDVDFGLSIAHVTAALGMSPGEALRHLSGEAPETSVEAPSGEAPETSVEAPVEGAPEAPAPAPVEALPPARLALVKPLPEEEAPEGARGAA